MWEGIADFIHEFLGRLVRTRGLWAAVVFLLGVSTGAIGGAVAGYFAASAWMQRAVQLANQRAETAETLTKSDERSLTQSKAALQQKSDEFENSRKRYEADFSKLQAVNDQLQAQVDKYEKENEARKRAEVEIRAKQQQTPKRPSPPKIPVLSDLPVDDQKRYGVPKDHPILILGRQYSITARLGKYEGGRTECILYVTNVSTNTTQDFSFREGLSGLLSVGAHNIRLVLMDPNFNGTYGYCMFEHLPD